MEAWVPSAFQEHPSIDVGNRYFTPSQHVLQDRQVSFSPVIDPDNILSEAMGEEFVQRRTMKWNITKLAKKEGELSESQIMEITAEF